jgi:hypothetical protein
MGFKSGFKKIFLGTLIVLFLSTQVQSQIGPDMPDVEMPPLISQYFPFSASLALVDFWQVLNFLFMDAIVQITKFEFKSIHTQSVINSTLLEARRYIHAGEQRYDSLIAPPESTKKGKLQLDIETYEKKYPSFKFGRDSITDPRDRRIYDKYAFLKEQFIPQWEARIRPCLNYVKSEFEKIRLAANKPLSDPDTKVLTRIVWDKLLSAINRASPLRIGGREYSMTDEEQVVQALSLATPAEALALCSDRENGKGPLFTLSLLTYALEKKATELSDDGGTPKAEMKVTVFNKTERIALIIYVKPKNAELDPKTAGILIYPEKVRPEDQIDPKGLRPGGSKGYSWVPASPEDEIWIRAMTLGSRRDQVKFQIIGGPQVKLAPEALPRNFYRLDYGTNFPNPIFTKWSVTKEVYSWDNFSGPWNVTGEPRVIDAPRILRDSFFGPENVTGDTIIWKLPDRDIVERLEELQASVNGTTTWFRRGPRTTSPEHQEEEKGSGLVTVRVEFW